MAAKLSDVMGQMKALKFVRAWKHSAGPVLLKQAQFLGVHFKEGTFHLSLDVSDPLWRQELEYQKDEILRRYNECLLTEGIPTKDLPKSCSLSSRASVPLKTVDPKKRRN